MVREITERMLHYHKVSEIYDAYFNGVKGKTIFSTAFGQSLFEGQENPRLESKVPFDGDDRSMTLVSAMVSEAYIDRLLCILLPKYDRLIDMANNFTFSTKIRLLESFEIVPSHLIRAADLVRLVRNQFAHDLNVSALRQVDPKILNKLRSLCEERKIRRNTGPEDVRVLFDDISYMATTVLYAYRENLKLFATAVRSPAFSDALESAHIAARKVELDVILKSSPSV